MNRFERSSSTVIAPLLGALAAAVFAATALAGTDGTREFSVTPPPPWAERIVPDLAAALPSAQLTQGSYVILLDRQTRVERGGRVEFRHLAIKAVNEKGVQAIADLEIPYDPSYQQLSLHSIAIHRDGKILPRLDPKSVRILQREKSLESRIYDGRKTAHVFLEDVRIGDVVDYAYSIRGSNPVLGEKTSGEFPLQLSVPLHRLSFRLSVPKGRVPAIAYHNGAPAPRRTEKDGYLIHAWDLTDVAALSVERDAPAWYDPYPTIEWSEYASWADVAVWAAALYERPARTGPLLSAEVTRIAREKADAESRFLAALDFVQRNVRYLGIEAGTSSHRPSAPEDTLQRRFGDCKDKSLLLVAMLQALGIEARPALVNSELHCGVADRQPGPRMFDHVIVRATVDGRECPTPPASLHCRSRIRSRWSRQRRLCSPTSGRSGRRERGWWTRRSSTSDASRGMKPIRSSSPTAMCRWPTTCRPRPFPRWQRTSRR